MSIIEDGATGDKVRVDGSNRLQVFAIAEGVNAFSVKNGDAYNLATGLVAMTGTAESSVFYMANTGATDIVITSITFGVGVLSATITDDSVFTIIKNPTGGDIISNATALAGGNTNQNHGESKSLSINAFQGVDGGTITGGESYGPFYVSSSQRTSIPLTMRIPNGGSVGVKVDLNTSGGGNVYCAINCHLHDDTQL